MPTDQSPRAPRHLSAAARKAWREVAQPGERPVCLPLVEALAVQMARMRDAQARIDGEGLIVADEKGIPVEHPALPVERLAHAKVRDLGAELAARRRELRAQPVRGEASVVDELAERAARRRAAASS